MAIKDKLTEVCTEQAITSGNQVSDNYMPLKSLRDIGEGNELWMEFYINETFTGGTTCRMGIGTSLVTPLDTLADVNLGQSEDIPVANLVAGETFAVAISHVAQARMGYAIATSGGLPVPFPGIAPAGVKPGGGVIYAVFTSVGTFSTGKVTASIVPRPTAAHPKLYPASFQVI